MKTKVAILIFISVFLVSCAPETPTQESQLEVFEIATETPTVEAPMVKEPVVIEEPVETETPTETPTEPPIACVTLLSPINGTGIPPVGKVTFSWTPMDEAGKYILNIILPSGGFIPFETDQAFYNRYMEAFVAGGEYQWQVIVQDSNGREICISEVATFEKPTYENPKDNNGNDGNNNGGGGGPGGGGCVDGNCGQD